MTLPAQLPGQPEHLALHATRTCPRRRSCSRRGRRRRLPGADLHAGRRAAVRRPSRRSAPATPGWRRRGAEHGDVIVQECGAGLVRCAAPRPGWRSPPAAACAPARWTTATSSAWRGRSASTAGIVDVAVGRQRPRLGRRAARRRRGGARRAAGPSTSTSAWSAPTRPAPSLRGAGVLPQGRRDGRGPGDRQPQRLGRAVADRQRPRDAPYVASQGTALGRAGRVHVSEDGDGAIWVGGGTVTCSPPPRSPTSRR